jgi:hypothetical protein
MTNQFHEANRRRWDAWSAWWAHRADTDGKWKKCHLDPSLALHSAELEWLRDVGGKKVGSSAAATIKSRLRWPVWEPR